MQYDCVTNEVHVVAPLRRSFECNTTLFDQVTAFYGNGCVHVSTKLSFRRRSAASGG